MSAWGRKVWDGGGGGDRGGSEAEGSNTAALRITRTHLTRIGVSALPSRSSSPLVKAAAEDWTRPSSASQNQGGQGVEGGQGFQGILGVQGAWFRVWLP